MNTLTEPQTILVDTIKKIFVIKKVKKENGTVEIWLDTIKKDKKNIKMSFLERCYLFIL